MVIRSNDVVGQIRRLADETFTRHGDKPDADQLTLKKQQEQLRKLADLEEYDQATGVRTGK
jgi:hypothetical protein